MLEIRFVAVHRQQALVVARLLIGDFAFRFGLGGGGFAATSSSAVLARSTRLMTRPWPLTTS
jgi:hypothetical protein